MWHLWKLSAEIPYQITMSADGLVLRSSKYVIGTLSRSATEAINKHSSYKTAVGVRKMLMGRKGRWRGGKDANGKGRETTAS